MHVTRNTNHHAKGVASKDPSRGQPGFTCLLCHGTDSRPWLSLCKDYFLGIGQPVDYVECDRCGLVQQWPLPENVAALYKDYPVHQRRSVMQVWARRCLQRQVYYRPSRDAAGHVLLDYGCGDGVYLREQESRFKERVGYEPGDKLAGALSKSEAFKVYSNLSAMVRDYEGQVDVVTAHFVLEHVTDLHETICLFEKLLKPGGLLHMAVPSVRSWEARLFKRKWHGLDPPRHISFPGVDAFERLARECGFEKPARRYAIFPNTLAASLVAALFGRHVNWLFQLLVLPAWLIAALAPSGTEVITMRKRGGPDE